MLSHIISEKDKEIFWKVVGSYFISAIKKIKCKKKKETSMIVYIHWQKSCLHMLFLVIFTLLFACYGRCLYLWERSLYLDQCSDRWLWLERWYRIYNLRRDWTQQWSYTGNQCRYCITFCTLEPYHIDGTCKLLLILNVSAYKIHINILTVATMYLFQDG